MPNLNLTLTLKKQMFNEKGVKWNSKLFHIEKCDTKTGNKRSSRGNLQSKNKHSKKKICTVPIKLFAEIIHLTRRGIKGSR